MGQLSDYDYDFSWCKINGLKTMRVFNATGAYVERFLQDQCPRLYNATREGEAALPTESTAEEVVEPALSAPKQSFYPKAWPIAVRSKRSVKQKTVPRLPVISHAE